MSSAEPDFLLYLDGLQKARAKMRGLQAEWADTVLTCPDLKNAASAGDVAGARTALLAATLRFWDPEDIPSRVRNSLNLLGVEVRP